MSTGTSQRRRGAFGRLIAPAASLSSPNASSRFTAVSIVSTADRRRSSSSRT
jgi:hypothetical protein